jgi:hypothetical protein
MGEGWRAWLHDMQELYGVLEMHMADCIIYVYKQRTPEYRCTTSTSTSPYGANSMLLNTKCTDFMGKIDVTINRSFNYGIKLFSCRRYRSQRP